jgi:CRISPR-associated protein Cmr1
LENIDMALRKPPASLDPKGLKIEAALPWATLHCQLVTPMYGGGVKAHTVDKDMPVRVSAIRGQLRFWWRLLAQHKWHLGNTNAIRAAEADIWGGIADTVEASKVFLRVSDVQGQQIAAWAKYVANNRGNKILEKTDWANVPYVLFPAQGKVEFGQVVEDPHELAKAGLNWQLHLSFCPAITDVQRQQVWEALRWWANFGGLGARTRRGLGAIQINKVTGIGSPENLLTPVSAQEAQQAGCQLLLRASQNDAYAAWQSAIRKLQEFRQLPPLARNPGQQPNRPGRSKWPEPDAIRRLTRRNAANHAPTHPAGNLFPRAAFGLPIIFHFQGQGEPGDTSLQPDLPKGQNERMASPVILRPYMNKDKKWAAAALLLPHAHINNLRLDLSGTKIPAFWNPAQASNVSPIAQNGGQDPLTAFMNYFAKP